MNSSQILRLDIEITLKRYGRKFRIDFTWDEITAMLTGFGYVKVKAGKTGGSRVRFDHRTADPIILHRPHPLPTLKRYQVEQVEEILKKGNLL